MEIRPIIVVHGGAWNIPPEEHPPHIEGCRRAALRGWEVLVSGGSALDAVEAAVRLMEDDPTFDAGKGSCLNAVGEVELDAIVMDGETLRMGAVAAVRRVANPVSLARLLMEKGPHTFLVGSGAEEYARYHGFPLIDPRELIVDRERERWEAWRNGQGMYATNLFGPQGTVGAVALDLRGNLAAATSTGGRPGKWPGRVGDSPLVGCGAYADNMTAAASATGDGEALMRIVATKSACDLVGQGVHPQEAARRVLALLEARTGGYGGLILLDREGRVGIAHTTPHMAWAMVRDGVVQAGI
ncbi:MAG: isoaspartyl peptidase/L-asparaginase [Anaerolineae bacterium]|nr:isoaspartyl peptidase/L-asparaginase [Anaerolineae bacterium]MCX8067973.1 isoaspartyl peptidase/L-asparaginase [Anaerolineae bacterium]MDW7991993.1 isoaspartyl peptidase/L-asparaginase [Anaerolineae bacterium]